MGECGCGNTNPDYRFAGPGRITYTVQYYTGCNNGCQTPAGIILSRYFPEDDEWASHAREVPWNTFGDRSEVRPAWYWLWRRLHLFFGIVWRLPDDAPGIRRIDWGTAWQISECAVGLTKKPVTSQQRS